MQPVLQVDFHLHSDLSDGYFAPAILAEKVASAGVHYAALTDHQTTEGWEVFREAFARRGGVAIPGVEVVAQAGERQVHLLAYGFDPSHPALRALLKSILPMAEACRCIHEADGVAFLAHPLHTWEDAAELEAGLLALVEAGLDGLEAIYGSYSLERREYLLGLADRHGLLVSAGSDFHGPNPRGDSRPGVEMESHQWKRFRGALPAFRTREAGTPGNGPRKVPSARANSLNWRWFLLNIALPAVLAVGAFIVAIFVVIIPAFESNLLARKREMIRELTNSAWSVLAEYDKEVRQGTMSLETAQTNAIERIRYLRYGAQGKDYFWITDMHPRMVMHPYREDLNGKDLSDFRDPGGTRPFVEFANLVREKDHGYVGYVWQWKDDPGRLEAKESYVRGFQPWGWLIGTGIYVEDVKREIDAITRQLIDMCVGITLVVGLLLLYMSHQSLKIERKRMRAERDLHESHERYRTLVEASTEGTLMVAGSRCVYANREMLTMTGHSEEELPLLDVFDLFAPDGGRSGVDASLESKEVPDHFEAALRRKDGTLLEVLVSPTRLAIGGRPGCILVAKDLSRHKDWEARLGESLGKYRTLVESIDTGVFRAAAGARWTLMEINPAARALLGLAADEALSGTALEDFLVVPEELSRFLHALLTKGSVRGTYLQLRRADGTLPTVAVSAVLVRSEDGQPQFCDGTIEDVTERRRAESEQEDLISQLQTSLLFLNEPIGNSMHGLLSVPMGMLISEAAELLSRQEYSALCVTGGDGDVVGIVTDNDFRSRVVAGGLDSSRPVREIMTAPVAAIPDSALAYEAIMLMRERGVRHLVVKNSLGTALGIVRNTELLRLHHYSPAVLSHEVRRARSVEEVAQARERLPRLVRALVEAGALPRNVARAITAVSDSVVDRLVFLALRDLGPPPVPFAFMALGSEGRGEQTLVTDQDNALIYEDPGPEAEDGAREYFLRLANRVCTDLNRAGYAFCDGDSMAKNPLWNQPLLKWMRHFTRWIEEPDAQDLLRFNIFFDVRCVYGEARLITLLRDHIHATMRRTPPFLFHMARNALQYKVPIGLFGQIVAAGAQPHSIDLKEALLPIVNFARLYALQQRVEETNTIDRLDGILRTQVLHRESHRRLVQSYDHLMLLRYRHQAAALADNRQPDNLLDLRGLTQIETSTLKQAFSQIATAQEKIGFDFPGACP